MFLFRQRFYYCKKRWVKLILLGLCFGLTLFGLIHLGRHVSLNAVALKTGTLAGMKTDQSEGLIIQVLPLTREGKSKNGWESFLHQLILSVTGVDSQNPALILGEGLNINMSQLAMTALAPSVEEEGGEEDFYLPGQENSSAEESSFPEEFPPVQINGEPMILVYTTHNAESYKSGGGVSRQEGENGGVAQVSKLFTQAMESKHGIKTVYSDMIHDYPDWTKSYINSMRTVQQILKKYPKIQVVLDIHRDAGLAARSDTLVKIGKKECAKVMIVVGTEHPNWKENLAFAEKIAQKADELYPGLIKTVRLRKERRYNQHLHPRALLLEVGSDLNKTEDAQNSAVLMSDVIAAVLKEK